MNEKKLVHNFKSYLGLEEQPGQTLEKEATFIPMEEWVPDLLPGENIIAQAHDCLMYTAVSDQQNGRFGSLFVTTYRLSFLTRDEPSLGCRQGNRLLGPNDVPLGLIASVVELSDADESGPKSRRRVLHPDRGLQRKGPVRGLQVICKNMRMFSFGFKFTAENKGRFLAAALLHHVYPRKNHLLFLFEYKAPYTPSSDVSDVNMFHKAMDWQKEMDRTNCRNWRLSRANRVEDSFFAGAGDALVVPSTVVDYQLAEAARHFRRGRVPVWVWSHPEGAALLRSGELYGGGAGANHAPESTLLEAARGAHPTKLPPLVITIPSRPLQVAYQKLTALCTPFTLKMFWEQDNKFLSSLENTRWLKYVSEYLSLAVQAAESLNSNETVVLQEGDGIDYCPIVSSLTQLLLDSHFRTIKGFQSLIQKEWVALGHPFCDRLGHVTAREQDEGEGDRSVSPMFLIFLDCAWQLTQQFPSSFQFTHVYLTTLWDSAHNQIFDTFVFNSPRERDLVVGQHNNLRPVWDWHEQFTDEEIRYFFNPVYSPPKHPTHPPRTISMGAIRLPGLASPSYPLPVSLAPSPRCLIPETCLSALQLWTNNYLRWLPPLNVQASGDTQNLIVNMALVKEIESMDPKKSRCDRKKVIQADKDLPELPLPSEVGTFFPFVGLSRKGLLAPPADSVSQDGMDQLDTQSILNGPANK